MSAAVVDVALDFSKTSPLRKFEKSRSPSPVPSVTSETNSRSESRCSDHHESEQSGGKAVNAMNLNPSRHGSLSSECSTSSTEHNSESATPAHNRPFKMYPMTDSVSGWYPGLSPSSTDFLSAYSASASVPFSTTLSGSLNPLYDSGLSALTLPLSAMLSRKRPRFQDPETSAKKSRQQPPLDSSKDETYWERRRKNNDAAKRSRDSRRQKEEEIAMRAAFLEQENLKLRAQVAILKSETAKLHYMLYSRSCS